MELIFRLFQGIFFLQVVHASIISNGNDEECVKCVRNGRLYCVSSEESGLTGCWTDLLPDLYHSCDQWIFSMQECTGKHLNISVNSNLLLKFLLMNPNRTSREKYNLFSFSIHLF